MQRKKIGLVKNEKFRCKGMTDSLLRRLINYLLAHATQHIRSFPFSALTLLFGRQEEHPACRKLDVVWW